MNISLKLEDMQAIVNEKWYVSMTIMARKDIGKYGDTHYVVENDYQKTKDVVQSAPTTNQEVDQGPSSW
jgi:hypothetical protein